MENRYHMTKERYLDWVKHPIKGGALYYIRLAWIVLMVINAGFVVYLFVNPLDLYFTTMMLILLLFCAYRVFFRGRILANRQFEMTAALAGADAWDRITMFSDKVTVVEGGTTIQLEYDKFTELIDFKDYLALGMGAGFRKSYLRLAKNGFVAHTEQEFIDFIRREHPNIPVKIKR